MNDMRKITKIVRNMQLYKNKDGNNELTDNEYEAVRYLTKKSGIKQNDLANYLNVDKALVSRIVSKLIKLDMIKVEDSPTDKRSKLLYPTAKSFELKEINSKEEVTFYNHIVAVLDESQKEVFYELLDKVYLESKRLRKNKYEGL